VDDETIFDFYSKYRLSDNNNEHSYILNVLMDASVRSYYSVGVKDISARTSNMTSADFKKRYNLTTPPTKFYKSSQPLSQSLYSKFKSSGVKSIRFKGGWSTLNSSILSYLSHNSCHITESSVTSISLSEKTLTLSDGSVHSFDHLISSINSDSLSGLLPNLEFKIKHIDWKILNLGYNSPPKLASFGYAVPGIENSNIFASVFNYNCFRENKPSVTILGKGDFDLIIKEFIKQSNLPYPDEAVGRTLESASPVYAVGHYKQQDLMASLPSWLHVIGHSFFHSGVPSCIIRAHETVSKILSK
jgi:protoporphyrinogen oxidase